MQRKHDTESQLYHIGFVSILLMVIGIFILKEFPILTEHHGLPCAFRMITGLYCPGCGGTRAVKLFLKGQIVSSFICHPLVPYMGIGGGIFMTSQTLTRLTGGRVRGMKFRSIYVYIMAVIIVVQFALKNVLLIVWGYQII